MKGTVKRKNSKKGKGKGGAKKANRARLHAGNNAYNAWMRTHTVQTGLDGTPQGKHDAKNKAGCRCGGCINKELESGATV